MSLISRLWKCFSIALHLIGTVVYGFTIVYQEFSNDRTDPRSTYVGDFKYMTYWNLVFQFVFNCLSLWINLFPKEKYVPSLREFLDGFFFCVVSPFSMFVCFSFWSLNLMDKSSVRNPNMENRFPDWYNHVTHTMNCLMNALEIMFSYHSTPDHGHGILVTIALYTCYTTFMYMFGIMANVWVYPFLSKLCWTKRLVFAVIGGIKLLLYYIVCVYLNKLLWPTTRIRRFQHIMS